MGDWSAGEYLRFRGERTRPAFDLAWRARDLLGDVALACPEVIDLGCGPGNSTAVLARVFPSAGLTGLDSSPDMIKAAKGLGLSARWICGDAAGWECDRPMDLVFSNAMLQWVADQEGLVRRMAGWLRPGGVLALQVPGNGRSPLHMALRFEAGEDRWRGRFDGLDDAIRYHEPDFWFAALDGLGLDVEVWESTYWHVLENQEALITWYAATGMRPWLDALESPEEQEGFKSCVLDKARPAYPARADGTVFFPFRRIFCTARRK